MKYKYLVFWIVSSTLIMAYVLGNYYRQIGFEYPIWYSHLLMSTFEPEGAEDAYDLYTYSNLILSFITSCMVTALFFVIKKMLKKSGGR